VSSARLPSLVRRAVAVGAIALSVLAAPVHISVVGATAPPVTPVPEPDSGNVGTNPFIPENVNIGDCVSSLPRPDCGDDQRSGYHQYLTLIVLFLATVFIFWRVFRGVRARDRAIMPEPTKPVDKH
jgi:hypothetical protein